MDVKPYGYYGFTLLVGYCTERKENAMLRSRSVEQMLSVLSHFTSSYAKSGSVPAACREAMRRSRTNFT